MYDNYDIETIRAILKNYFLTGKRPTQCQYHELIDAILDKDIFVGDVDFTCHSLLNVSSLSYTDLSCNRPLFINNDVVMRNLTADNVNILHYEISGFDVAGDLGIQQNITVSGIGLYLQDVYVSGLLLTPCGDSSDWCSVFNTVLDLSSNWNSAYTQVNGLSSNWSSVYTQVNNLSDHWDGNFCDEVVVMNRVSACNNTISMSANLNLNGYSISGIGNNSLQFESGTRISSLTSNMGAQGLYIQAGYTGSPFITRTFSIEHPLVAGKQYVFSTYLSSLPGDVLATKELLIGGSTVGFLLSGQNDITFTTSTSITSYAVRVTMTPFTFCNVVGLGTLINSKTGYGIRVDNKVSTPFVETDCGNSTQWCNTYNTVLTSSPNWNSVYTSVLANSANWNSVYSTMFNNSAIWNSVYSTVSTVSADWNSVYTSVNGTSAIWNSVYSTVFTTSANWNSVYTVVNNTSGNWNSVYTQVNELSDSWVKSDGLFCDRMVLLNDVSACYGTVNLSGGLAITDDLAVDGTISASCGNSTQWCQAYTWGNHVTASSDIYLITPAGSPLTAVVDPANGPVQGLVVSSNMTIHSVTSPTSAQYHLVTLLIDMPVTYQVNWSDGAFYALSFPSVLTSTGILTVSGTNTVMYEYRWRETKPIAHIVDVPEAW